MDETTTGSLLPQGENNDQSNSDSTAIKLKVDKLSQLQQDRFYSLYHRFGESTFVILDHFKPKRGKHQWEDFVKRVDAANNSKSEHYEFIVALAEAFEIDKAYVKFDIVELVHKVRNSLSLDTHTSDIAKKCLDDLGSAFLVAEKQDGDQITYTPIVSLVIS